MSAQSMIRRSLKYFTARTVRSFYRHNIHFGHPRDARLTALEHRTSLALSRVAIFKPAPR